MFIWISLLLASRPYTDLTHAHLSLIFAHYSIRSDLHSLERLTLIGRENKRTNIADRESLKGLVVEAVSVVISEALATQGLQRPQPVKSCLKMTIFRLLSHLKIVIFICGF